MNLASILVLAVVGVFLALAVWRAVKKGVPCECGCDCCKCDGGDDCHCEK